MAARTISDPFRRGFVDGLPFVIGGAAFGTVFAVVATEAGLNLWEVMAMSVLVIAGAAQFAALAQMQDAAPVFFVLAAALTVNLRMAMYSASIGPYLRDASFWQRALAAYVLVDNAYAVAFSEFEEKPQMSVAQKTAYYFGCAVPVWITWYVAAFVGAYLGKSIPNEWALDFAVPLAFIAIAAPMLRTLAHVAAAMTSIICALLFAFLPYSSGLFVAAALAMLVGSEVERRMVRVSP